MFKILLIVILVALSGQTFALRCGNEIIAIGDNRAKLIKFCGKPIDKYTLKQKKLIRQSTLKTKKKAKQVKWIYNFGPNDFIYEIILENGKIAEIIKDKGYGY